MYKFVFRSILLSSLVLLNTSLVFADTVAGNGYELEQALSVTSAELTGNGYTSTQVLVPIFGVMSGNGYSASQSAPSNPIPVSGSVVAGSSSSASSGGGYVLAFSLPGVETAYADSVQVETESIAVQSRPDLSRQIDELVEPFITGPGRGLTDLYQELGDVVDSVSTASGPQDVATQVVRAVETIYNSKSTFSVLTMAVVVLLFMSLGVSVFGYKEIHKIITAVVCFGSLFGYYTTSEIYLLPAIVGLIVLAIFVIQQKEHEVSPIQDAE